MASGYGLLVLTLRTGLLLRQFVLLAGRGIQLTSLDELVIADRRGGPLLAADGVLKSFSAQFLCARVDGDNAIERARLRVAVELNEDLFLFHIDRCGKPRDGRPWVALAKLLLW